MSYQLQGNLVTPSGVFYGTIVLEGNCITSVSPQAAEAKTGADYILPGFIELHLHGTGPYTSETAEGVAGMATYSPAKGTTRFCPTLCCAHNDFYRKLLPEINALRLSNPPGSVIDCVYIEGPWVSLPFKGGMHADLIHPLTNAEADEILALAPGLVKIMAIAPEEPGALDFIRHMTSKGVVMSLAHSACKPEDFPAAVEAGIRQMTHLFDAYDVPVSLNGVRQPALTDMGLIDDRVMKEVIMDGKHVPPELVRLAIRAAGVDHILSITDALQGAGMSHCRFQDMGTWYHIENEGDLALVEEDGSIVGSSLTQNMAFFNLVTKFGVTPRDASRMLSANQAKVLGLAGKTGELLPGLQADVTVLAADCRTVKACFVQGKAEFQA